MKTILSFDQTDFKDQSFKNIYFIYNGNETRQIKLDEKVLNFKKSLIEDQIKNLKNKSLNCEIINIQDLKDMEENLLALYPSIGENLDYINSNNLKNINFLYRKIDQYSWKYCNKGFFNFKKLYTKNSTRIYLEEHLFRAILYPVPVQPPFFSPNKRSFANWTNFRGQILFFHLS